MALSGSFGSNVGPYWRLQLEWTAVQNVSDNESTITAKLYWMAQRSGVGAVYASQADAVNINIDGTNSPGATVSPYLSAGQKKLIRTWSRTVSHNSTGVKNAPITAYFDVKATLSGTYYGRVSISGNADLNDIPRASSLSAAPNWTAGKDFTLAVNRASSAFSHVLELYIKNTSGNWISIIDKSIPKTATSINTNFPTLNNAYIFQHLNGRASADSRVIVKTYNGSTLIGSTTRDGTITTPLASFPEAQSSFIVGNAFNVDVKWYLPEFRHTVRLINGIGGTVLKSYTNVADSVNFDTASIVTALRNLMPTTSKKELVIEVSTYFEGILVRAEKYTAIEARIATSYPTFTATPAHRDTNTATVAITGSNQQIVTGKSLVTVDLPAASRAIATDGATMVRYVATLGGKTVVQNWSASATVSFVFGAISAKTNQTLSIRAEDSRGASTIVTKTIPVIPYDPPTLTTMATRVNGFEATTLLKMSGRLSALSVAGVNKNSVQDSRFRYKETAVGTYGSWINMPVTGFPNYASTIREEVLDSTKSYHVQFEIRDRLSTTSITKTIATGKPLMFFDELLNAIGIGDLPANANELMIALQVRLAGNRFGANAGIDMQNSDIRNANGIFMNDVSASSGEGINFLKTGAPVSSPSAADYESLRGLDGVLDFAGKPVAIAFKEVHWSGFSFMHGTVTINLVRPLSQCPNGLILIWSRYTAGAVVDTDWNVTFIPKWYATYTTNGMWHPLVAANADATVPALCYKYIYPKEDRIVGHSRNNTGAESGQVLRAIVTF